MPCTNCSDCTQSSLAWPTNTVYNQHLVRNSLASTAYSQTARTYQAYTPGSQHISNIWTYLDSTRQHTLGINTDHRCHNHGISPHSAYTAHHPENCLVYTLCILVALYSSSRDPRARRHTTHTLWCCLSRTVLDGTTKLDTLWELVIM